MEQDGRDPEFFSLETRNDGVAVVTFSRPPVNAVSISVYEQIGQLADRIEADDAIRCVVLTAPETSKAWCGGADVRDFVGMNPERRKERYAFINAQLPRFYHMEKPIIAAINGPAIGIGMILAGLCDMRVAAEGARFACPEIDFGLVAGGAGLFAMLKFPEAKMRELLYTGRRFTARELEPTGFFNHVVPAEAVLPKSLEIAAEIARKSLPVIRARKRASNALEGKSWMTAYLEAQALSAGLVATADSAEGVNAFLERREAKLIDR